jgi:predicted transcriptional regulator
MPATSIRIRPASHRALKELAAMTGQSVQDVLDEAIDDRKRRLYLEGVNADYAALNQNPKAKEDFEKEMAAWDTTNLDGLEKL